MPATERSRPLRDLSMVALTHEYECKGRLLPEGSRGAIVYAYRDGSTYEVEFTLPFACVLTLRARDIRPV
jgi:hypothetical protein